MRLETDAAICDEPTMMSLSHDDDAAPDIDPPGPLVVVVMGVSGSGKSTVGAALAQKLGWPFQDGDDLHPAANVAKMAAGTPLTDADRAPWLERIAHWISERLDRGESGVIACSALKRAYRRAIVGGQESVRLVFLTGDREVIGERIARRRGHMPAGLLSSQLATLEPPGLDERPITVDVDLPVDTQVTAIVAALRG